MSEGSNAGAKGGQHSAGKLDSSKSRDIRTSNIIAAKGNFISNHEF